MGAWYAKPLGDPVTALELQDSIRREFDAAFTAAGQPATMAVFLGVEADGDLHCEATAYFSPAAADLARRLGARPCNPPARDALELLAGRRRCWDALF